MNRKSFVGVSLAGLVLAGVAVVLTTQTQQVDAHCQVPCGIYDDAARIARLREDTATIAKAINGINELAGSHDGNSLNQASRWINTKEIHASHIIEVVSEYFLTQKVKVVPAGTDGHDKYLKKLADHHAVMVAAMKTKQHANPKYVDGLRHAIDALATHYQ